MHCEIPYNEFDVMCFCGPMLSCIMCFLNIKQNNTNDYFSLLSMRILCLSMIEEIMLI